jgi:hypothetical protein
LSYYLKFKSKPDITNNFIIKKLLNGDKRLAAGSDINRPITVTVLGHLLQALAHVTKLNDKELWIHCRRMIVHERGSFSELLKPKT